MRVRGALISIAVLGAVASPLRHDLGQPGRDDFPLSTYPMFATPRSTRLTMDYAIGIGADHRTFLAPLLIGSPEVLQARALVARAVSAGREAQDDLCRRIAARVAADPSHPRVTQVLLVQGQHDAIDLLVHGSLGAEHEWVRCDVPRGTP